MRDVRIAYSRGSRKAWLLEHTHDEPWGYRITQTLPKKEAIAQLNAIIAENQKRSREK